MLRLSSHLQNLYWECSLSVLPWLYIQHLSRPYFNRGLIWTVLQPHIPISVEQAKLPFNWLNCFDHMWSPFSSIPTMRHTQLRFHKRSRYRIICFYYYCEWSKKVMKPEMLTISAQWASSIHATTFSRKALLLISVTRCPLIFFCVYCAVAP